MPGERLLERAIDPVEVEQLEQRLEDERAGDRAHHGAAAATEHGPAEHRRGDRLELEPDAHLRGDSREPGEQDARDHSGCRRDHERDRTDPGHVDPGERRRAVVVPDREHPPPEAAAGGDHGR